VVFAKLQRFLNHEAMPLNLEVEHELRQEAAHCRIAIDAANRMKAEDASEKLPWLDENEVSPVIGNDEDDNETGRVFIDKIPDPTDPEDENYRGYIALVSDMKKISNMDLIISSYILAINNLPSESRGDANDLMTIFEAYYNEGNTPEKAELESMLGAYDQARESLIRERRDMAQISDADLRIDTVANDKENIELCLQKNHHLEDEDIVLAVWKYRPDYIPQEIFKELIDDMIPHIRFENHDATAATMLNDALEKYAPQERSLLTGALKRHEDSLNLLDTQEAALHAGKRCLQQMIKEIGYMRATERGRGGLS